MFRRGDEGEGVKALQEALNAAGCDCGRADGAFGGRTESAVRAFETAHGLEADGIAWPGVLKLLGLVAEPSGHGPARSPMPGHIQLTAGNFFRMGDGPDEEITQRLTVANRGHGTMEVWVRFAEGSSGAFEDWPGDGEGSVVLAPGEAYGFSCVFAPSAEELGTGALARTVIAEGVDSGSGAGYVNSVDLSYALDGALHVNGFGDPAHEAGYRYQEGDELHMDFTALVCGGWALKNLSIRCAVSDPDGEVLFEETLHSDDDGEPAAEETGAALFHTITAAEAACGEITVACWAEADRADQPGERLVSENTWIAVIPTGEAPDSGEGLAVTVSAPAGPYAAGETIALSVTVTNVDTSPVAQLTATLQGSFESL